MKTPRWFSRSIPVRSNLRVTIASALVLGAVAMALVAARPSSAVAPAVTVAQKGRVRPLCEDNPAICTETYQRFNYEGNYTGHDEPALLFYSNKAGSGNSNVYRITLPTDPPTLPKQDGTGGTFNFQLHPAFWFGMAMCDTQSDPNFTTACTPDSDTNIFDNPNPTASDYIGHHPGTAFMEMQFYPPGWVAWPPGNSCDATHYCAALNIDSFSDNPNTGQNNTLPA